MSFIIGLIGKVSAGKTTLLNYLLENYYGETSKKKTTHVPSFFSHMYDKQDSIDSINEKIQHFNNTSHDNADALYFNVPITRLAKFNPNISLVDFPGLDDDEGIEKHFDTHVNKLDCIIFVTDANSSMNTKSERDVFTKIVNKVKINHQNCRYTKLLVVFNKFDDDEDEELNLNIHTAKTIINEIIKEYSIELEFFNISSIKMMVKNTLENDRKSIKLIPNQVLKNVLTQYHGIKKAKAILKKNIIKKTDLNEIDITSDEKSFILKLQRISKPTIISKLYREKYIERIDGVVLSSTLIQDMQRYLDYHYLSIKNGTWVKTEIIKKMEKLIFNCSNLKSKTLQDFYDVFQILFNGKLKMSSGSNLFVEYERTPKELICKMKDEYELTIPNDQLINFATIFKIDNFIELSQNKEQLYDILVNNEEMKKLIDDKHIEDINQYNDYLLILNSSHNISRLFLHEPDLFSKLIINYVNHIPTSQLNMTIYNTGLAKSVDVTRYREQSKSIGFKLLKKNIHKYPVYVKMYLREIQDPQYMNLINETTSSEKIITKISTEERKTLKCSAQKNDIEYISDDEEVNEEWSFISSDFSEWEDEEEKVKYE